MYESPWTRWLHFFNILCSFFFCFFFFCLFFVLNIHIFNTVYRQNTVHVISNVGSTICTLGTRSPPLLEDRIEPGVCLLVCVCCHDNSGKHGDLYRLCKLGQIKQRLCSVQRVSEGVFGFVYSCYGFDDCHAGKKYVRIYDIFRESQRS